MLFGQTSYKSGRKSVRNAQHRAQADLDSVGGLANGARVDAPNLRRGPASHRRNNVRGAEKNYVLFLRRSRGLPAKADPVDRAARWLRTNAIRTGRNLRPPRLHRRWKGL